MEQTIITTYYHLRGTKNPPTFPAYNTSTIADASERLPVRKHIIGIHFLVRPTMRKLTLGAWVFQNSLTDNKEDRLSFLERRRIWRKRSWPMQDLTLSLGQKRPCFQRRETAVINPQSPVHWDFYKDKVHIG